MRGGNRPGCARGPRRNPNGDKAEEHGGDISEINFIREGSGVLPVTAGNVILSAGRAGRTPFDIDAQMAAVSFPHQT